MGNENNASWEGDDPAKWHQTSRACSIEASSLRPYSVNAPKNDIMLLCPSLQTFLAISIEWRC